MWHKQTGMRQIKISQNLSPRPLKSLPAWMSRGAVMEHLLFQGEQFSYQQQWLHTITKISTMLGCSPALHYSGLGEPLICPVKWIWAVTLVNLIVLCVFWKLDHPRTESWYIMPRLSVLIMFVVMFISQLHALYFPGLWQKVENFAGSLSDIITIFSFYWH